MMRGRPAAAAAAAAPAAGRDYDPVFKGGHLTDVSVLTFLYSPDSRVIAAAEKALASRAPPSSAADALIKAL